MSQTVLVCVAWPYANTPLHAGQIAGAYLPADIFARYHRMRGNRVLMISGSDAHGTPITVRAVQEGSSPQAVFERNHASFLDTFERAGISFDLFTSTATENHARVSQDLFTRLREAGHIYPGEQTLLYDPKAQRFLPDRYVEGTCPRCGYDGARGDQCDNCGSTLDATDLINPRSRFSDATPEPRASMHYFLRLSAFNEPLREWVEQQTHWRPAVRNFTLGLLREGLHDRGITRDLDWGIPVPVEGFEGKRIYVWFEAVIGYLSASIEWAQSSDDPEAWRAFWEASEARTYYFQGKDNVPFHTTIWPAMLMGVGSLNLPYDIPANQYVTMSGAKASSSRNWAVWMPDYLDRRDPDPLRYVLSAIMPETSDSDFTWAEYLRRNNDELVATWGNLVNRVLTFTRRNFDARVPDPPATLSEASQALLAKVDAAFEVAAGHIEAVQLRAALQTAMAVAQESNRYLDERAPWAAIKEDRESAAETLYTAINVISGLATLFQPFMPFTSPRAWAMAGNAGHIEASGWSRCPVTGGTPLPEPAPLFKKLDDSLVEEEEARLGVVSAPVVDAHSHTASRQFDEDRAAMYQRAWDAGLVHIVEVGGSAESSRRALALAKADPRIHAVAGVHPHEAQHLDGQRDELRALIASGDFVGVGEIGFDFFYNHSPVEAQYEAFMWQLDLAREAELPVVIHCREADEDGFAILNEWAGRVGRYLGPDREIGMLHCFSGDADLAARYIEIGFLISIPGPVTYKNNDRGQGVARTIPLRSMLVETDAPHLTPTPYRGTRNEPAYVVETARFVAELRGCSFDEVAEATARNASRLFGFTL